MRDWLKVHRKMHRHREYVAQPLTMRGAFLTLLLESDDRGTLPDLEDTAFVQRVSLPDLKAAVAWLERIGWVHAGAWTKWAEYQPDSSAARVRAHREHMKQAIAHEPTEAPCNDCNVTGATVTQSRVEEKRREEILDPLLVREIQSAREAHRTEEVRETKPTTNGTAGQAPDHSGILAAWNGVAEGSGKTVGRMTTQRKAWLVARCSPDECPEAVAAQWWVDRLSCVNISLLTSTTWFTFDWLIGTTEAFDRFVQGTYSLRHRELALRREPYPEDPPSPHPQPWLTEYRSVFGFEPDHEGIDRSVLEMDYWYASGQQEPWDPDGWRSLYEAELASGQPIGLRAIADRLAARAATAREEQRAQRRR